MLGRRGQTNPTQISIIIGHGWPQRTLLHKCALPSHKLVSPHLCKPAMGTDHLLSFDSFFTSTLSSDFIGKVKSTQKPAGKDR